MKILVAVLLSLFALWSGYWLAGSALISNRIPPATEALRAQGLDLTFGDQDVAGFPNRFDVTLTDPRLLDPGTGFGWQAPFAQVLSMTWKPWHLIAVLPDSQTLITPMGEIALTSTRARASLQLTPSTTPDLVELVVELQDLAATGTLPADLRLASGVFALRQMPGFAEAPAYRLGLTLKDLTPLLGSGPLLDILRLDAMATLSQAKAGPPRGLAALDLTDLWLERGTLRLAGSGQIAADAGGLATGEIRLKVTGWADLPAFLADFGLLAPGLTPVLGRALTVIAEDQGHPETLDLTLTFREGGSFLGPLPLGPAPLLIP